MQEIYVSIDVESDGPIPGPNSMLSLGAAAYTPKKKLHDTFSINLETLPGAKFDPVTKNWWDRFPKAYAKTRKNCIDPKLAMFQFTNWAEALPARPILVGLPITFDFMFVHWYLMNFLGRTPFSFIGIDIRSYAFAKLGIPFKDCVRSNFPRQWFDDLPHTHVAVEDAIEQGALFCNMLADEKEYKNREPKK